MVSFDASSSVAALIATSTISFAPSIILVLFPNFQSDSLALSLGKCLAAGGLLGDVFLHVLPHASEHDPEAVGWMLLIGFCSFFLFDLIVRSVNGGHCHKHGHGDGKAVNGDSKGEGKGKSWSEIFTSSTVLLNLAADSLHNFTDGLSIGASFGAASGHSHEMTVFELIQSRGGVASLSVLFHEIPHELGDFSVLMSEGFSKTQAIVLQAVTAIAAFLGTIVGLAAIHLDGVGDALMPFTAGGFIYLASVTILPDVLAEEKGPRRRLLQFLSFLAGIAFLHLVSIMEHNEGECHGHGHGHGHNHGHHHGHEHHSHENSHNHHHEHSHDHHHHHEL